MVTKDRIVDEDEIFTSEDNLVILEENGETIYRPKRVWTIKKDAFTLSPLYDYFRWQEIMGIYVTGQNYLKFDLTEKFLSDLKFRVDHQMNIIISIWGLTGTGKSAASLVIALLLSLFHKKKWSFSMIKDNPNDILLSIQQNDYPKGSVFVIDEQDTTRAGMNASTMMSLLNDLEKRIRRKQWHFIYNSPAPLQHSHHYLMKTDGIDREKGQIRLKIYDAIGILHGTIIIPFPPKKIWEQYDGVFKKEILDDATSFLSTEEKQIDKLLEELYENPFFWAMDNNSQRDVYLLMRYPTICRSKTFRAQMLSIFGTGGKKEHIENMRKASVHFWMEGEISPKDASIVQRLRPAWYQQIERFEPGAMKGRDPDEFFEEVAQQVRKEAKEGGYEIIEPEDKPKLKQKSKKTSKKSKKSKAKSG